MQIIVVETAAGTLAVPDTSEWKGYLLREVRRLKLAGRATVHFFGGLHPLTGKFNKLETVVIPDVANP